MTTGPEFRIEQGEVRAVRATTRPRLPRRANNHCQSLLSLSDRLTQPLQVVLRLWQVLAAWIIDPDSFPTTKGGYEVERLAMVS